MARAQASIEYLLLLAILLSFFAALAPLMYRTYSLAFYASDVLAAKNFASSLELRAGELSFLGNGSSFQLEARPVNEWLIESDGHELVLRVESKALGVEKTIPLTFPNEIPSLRQSISEKSFILLRKENGLVFLDHVNNNPVPVS